MTSLLFISTNPYSVEMLMNRDPGMISTVLDFFTKRLEKYENKTTSEDEKEDMLKSQKVPKVYENFKEKIGIEKKGGGHQNIFYLWPCKELGGESLLKYLDTKTFCFLRQRRELIELSVKIARLNHGQDSKEAMKEVINHYKSCLPSGPGLRDLLNMIKEQYPLSTLKALVKITVSLLVCTMTIGFYVFDIYTDVRFSLKMLNGSEDGSFDMHSHNFSHICVPESCQPQQTALDTCLELHYSKSEAEKNLERSELRADMIFTGWIAVWHCIQPFFVSFIVFLSMNCSCSSAPAPEAAYRPSRGAISLLSVLPIPVFTNIYRFYLSVRFNLARSQPDFKKKIGRIEQQIQDHKNPGREVCNI